MSSSADDRLLKLCSSYPHRLSNLLGDFQERLRQREVFDTLRADFMVCFGKWDFDPMQMRDPFPGSTESTVHMWQGHEDKVVPVELQRCISEELPWIRYHEIPGGGHLIVHYDGMCDAIVKALLIGEEPLTEEDSQTQDSNESF